MGANHGERPPPRNEMLYCLSSLLNSRLRRLATLFRRYGRNSSVKKLPSGIRPGVGSVAPIAPDCLGRPIFMTMIERDDCSPSRCIAKSGRNDDGPLR